MNLLLIRFSSLGDIILHSSIPRAIKERWGDKVRIHFLTADGFAPLLEGMEGIDQIHSLPRARGAQSIVTLYQQVKKIIKEQEIDGIVDLHGTLRSLLIRILFPHIPRVAVDKRTVERGLLTNLRMDFLSWQFGGEGGTRFWSWGGKNRLGEPLLKRNVLDLAPLFDLKIDLKARGPSLENYPWSSCSVSKWNEEALGPIREKFGLLSQKKWIAIVPSASFPEKRWEKERFLALMEKLAITPEFEGHGLIILAGKEDVFCQHFNELCERFPGRVLNLQGKTSLVESAAILKICHFCIGNDTGLPHIAESVGTKALFILGPTGEEFGFYPHLPTSKMAALPLWCRPCTTNGKGRCIRTERFCLTQISVEQVFNLALELVRERRVI